MAITKKVGLMEAVIGLNSAVTVYQMTKMGLAMQATLQGTITGKTTI